MLYNMLYSTFSGRPLQSQSEALRLSGRPLQSQSEAPLQLQSQSEAPLQQTLTSLVLVVPLQSQSEAPLKLQSQSEAPLQQTLTSTSGHGTVPSLDRACNSKSQGLDHHGHHLPGICTRKPGCRFKFLGRRV